MKVWSNFGLRFFLCTLVSNFGFLSGNKYNFTNGSVKPVDQSVGGKSLHSRTFKTKITLLWSRKLYDIWKVLYYHFLIIPLWEVSIDYVDKQGGGRGNPNVNDTKYISLCSKPVKKPVNVVYGCPLGW